jgi:hypothetical protein
MGMFNVIYADLLCPVKKEISKNTQIQIKWQKQEARVLNFYHKEDFLEDIEEEWDNNWIRTDYICNVCSKQSRYKDGFYIKVEDQQRHLIFVNVEQGWIKEILTESDFQKSSIKEYIEYD